MPYYVFMLRPFTAPEKLAEHAVYAEASSHAKALRAAHADEPQARIRLMFGENEQQAEDLVCQVRDPRPAEDDD